MTENKKKPSPTKKKKKETKDQYSQIQQENIKFQAQIQEDLNNVLNNIRMRYNQNDFLYKNLNDQYEDIFQNTDNYEYKIQSIGDNLKNITENIRVLQNQQKELNYKLQQLQSQDGAIVGDGNKQKEFKENFIKENNNLLDYDIFKYQQNMSKKKKEALKGTAGRVLIDFALYHQQVNDTVQVLKGEDIESEEEDIDLQKNIRWQSKQVLKVYYGNSQNSVFSMIKVQRKTVEADDVEVIKITFAQLLSQVSRYWSLDEKKSCLVDRQNNIWPYTAVVFEEQMSFKNDLNNVLKEDIFIRIITLEQLRKINIGGDDDADHKKETKKVVSKRKKVQIEESESSESSDEEDDDEGEEQKQSCFQKFKKKVKLVAQKIYEIYLKIKKSVIIYIVFLQGQLQEPYKKYKDKVKNLPIQLIYTIFLISFVINIIEKGQIKQANHCIEFLEKNLFGGTSSNYKGYVLGHDGVNNQEEAFYFIINNLMFEVYSDQNLISQKKGVSQQIYYDDKYLIMGRPSIRFNRVTDQTCKNQQLTKLQFGNKKCYPNMVYDENEDHSDLQILPQLREFCYLEPKTCQYSSIEEKFKFRVFNNDRISYGVSQDFLQRGIIITGEPMKSAKSTYDVLLELVHYMGINIFDITTRSMIFSCNFYHVGYDILIKTDYVVEQLNSGQIKTRLRTKAIKFQNQAHFDNLYEFIIRQIMLFSFLINFILVFRNIFKIYQKYGYECRKLMFLNRDNPDYVIVRKNEPTLMSIQNGWEVCTKMNNIFYYIFAFTFIAYQSIHQYNRDNYSFFTEGINFFIDDIEDLTYIENVLEVEMILETLCITFAFLNIFKFFEDSKIIGLFNKTILNTMTQQIGWLIYGFVLIAIFSLIAQFVMGVKLNQYSYYFHAVYQCFYIMIGKYQFNDLTTYNFTAEQLTYIYIYYVSFIFVVYFIYKKIITIIFLVEYTKLKQDFKYGEYEVDDLFFYFKFLLGIFEFLVLKPVLYLLNFLIEPLRKLKSQFKNKRLYNLRKKYMEIYKKQNVEKEKTIVLLRYGEEVMQNEFRITIQSDEDEITNKINKKKPNKKKQIDLENSQSQQQETPIKSDKK